MTVLCDHAVIESAHSVGICELGDGCPISDLREADYERYRDSHRTALQDWLVETE